MKSHFFKKIRLHVFTCKVYKFFQKNLFQRISFSKQLISIQGFFLWLQKHIFTMDAILKIKVN